MIVLISIAVYLLLNLVAAMFLLTWAFEGLDNVKDFIAEGIGDVRGKEKQVEFLFWAILSVVTVPAIICSAVSYAYNKIKPY